ncbi:hypothetical protein [Oceanisphaera sp. W20_SRM_FM3]|uniref:hypothetical protein n=1 Tax=Oceanisphaera sp. W20_SRM_FM3 TaxID=3240267 RepID=UPI003F9838B9
MSQHKRKTSTQGGTNNGQSFATQNRGEVRPFSLQLTRKVQLKRFPIIAKLTFLLKRPDLVSLLNAVQQEKNIPLRLKAYLQREALWDDELSTLTDRGLAVQSSGTFESKERGLYHIWYIDNDPLLQIRPVLIQRDTAFFEPSTKAWLKGVDAAQSEFKVDKNLDLDVIEEVYNGRHSTQELQKLTLLKLEPEVVCAADRNAELDLVWSLSLAQSLVSLEGQLDVLEFKQKKGNRRSENFNLSISDFQEHLPTVMSTVALQLDGYWSSKDHRLAINQQSLESYSNAIARFKIDSKDFNDLETPYGRFNTAELSNIPVKPENSADAQLWHQQWLGEFYAEAYHSSERARQQQAQWLDDPALTGFDLSLVEGSSLLDSSLDREKQPQAYWHVAAIADLTPSQSKKLRLPISLINDDELNIKELVTFLTGNDTVEKIIYSDRYVHTSRQNRNLATIASCVSNADGFLFTLESQKGNEATLPLHWCRTVMQKENDNHGRYWIFIGEKHTYCWECTSGLDFIRDTEKGLIVTGTPSFTPKEEHELPQFLKIALKRITSVEVA